MSSIITKLRSDQTTDQQALGALISIIEDKYPDQDTNDIKTLTDLINKEFNASFTEGDIVNHYVIQMEEKDRRLTYKHYVGC